MEVGHPNLLPAFFEGDPRRASPSPRHRPHAALPARGREHRADRTRKVLDSDDGPYGAEGHILQDAAPLYALDGYYAA